MKQLVIGYVLLLGMPVAAQIIPAKNKEHSIKAGTGFKEIRDNYILPYSVEGNILYVGYSFLQSGEAKKEIISAEWNKGSLSNSGAGVRINDFSLRFSQAFSLVKSRDKRLNYFAGYSIHTAPSFIKLSDKGDKEYSWSTSSNISVYQSLVYTRGRNRLSLDMYIPVIGLASRPDDRKYYSHTANGVLYDSYSDLFFTSWHNQQAISASVDFCTALSRGIRIIVGGKYDYNHLEKADGYSDSRIGMYAGLSFTLQ
jgi:hypothetical protein